VRFAWIQWGIEGRPHARAIVEGACPALRIGAATVAMRLRAQPQPGYPDTVCDAPLPANFAGARIGPLTVPAVPRAPSRIAVFGDTGCRVQGRNLQACNDPNLWPMAKIVRSIAAERPQLVIHAGDYYYRETACAPAAAVNCTNTPFGDTSESWLADWFVPAAPLFATAPLVLVRGNHEDCKRGGIGWSRYLSGLPGVVCSQHEDPGYASFAGLLLANVDSAYGNEYDPDASAFVGDERLVDSRASVTAGETWLLTHRPPMAYLAAHADDERNGTHIAAFVAGHIHLFGAYAFPAAPPQLIVGTGGDTLAGNAEAQTLALLGGVTEVRFGYAIFDRAGAGWDIGVHDPDGSLRRRCRLERRTVRCA
jgi:hypothetical protein